MCFSHNYYTPILSFIWDECKKQAMIENNIKAYTIKTHNNINCSTCFENYDVGKEINVFECSHHFCRQTIIDSINISKSKNLGGLL